MLKTIVIIVVVLITGVPAYAATRPDTFRVERAASIKAPPDKVFALINDFPKIALRLEFEKPFEAHNRVEFTLKSVGDATDLRWTR